MSHLLIALTFDGGPDGVAAGAAAGKRYNTTERVLRLLKDPASLDPRLRVAQPIRGAFFVQTHVPGRMASREGKLGTGATLTPGQALVRRMMEEGHLVGVLNGSEKDLEDHLGQARGMEPPLRNHLTRAVAALATLVPGGEGKQQAVEFVRSPFGMHDADCDAVYREVFPDPGDPSKSLHSLWHTSAALVPPGDLCLGVSVRTMAELLAGVVRKAARRMRTLLEKTEGGASPAPIPLVIRLHDISVGTAAHLPRLVAGLLDGARLDGGQSVPVQFCSTFSEVRDCLRAAPQTSTHLRLAQLRASQPYSPEPRMTQSYGSEEETLLSWALIQKEGWVNHLYLDSENLVTAGVGTRIFLGGEPAVARLPLRDEAGEVAAERKEKAFRDLVAAAPRVPQKPLLHRLRTCRTITGLDLTDAATVDLLHSTRQQKLEELGAALRTAGIALAGLPPPVRIALADMIFNLGRGGLLAFRRLLESVRGTRWAEAAERCRRTVNGQVPPGLKERNDATRDLFLAAHLLDPSSAGEPAPASALSVTYPKDLFSANEVIRASLIAAGPLLVDSELSGLNTELEAAGSITVELGGAKPGLFVVRLVTLAGSYTAGLVLLPEAGKLRLTILDATAPARPAPAAALVLVERFVDQLTAERFRAAVERVFSIWLGNNVVALPTTALVCAIPVVGVSACVVGAAAQGVDLAAAALAEAVNQMVREGVFTVEEGFIVKQMLGVTNLVVQVASAGKNVREALISLAGGGAELVIEDPRAQLTVKLGTDFAKKLLFLFDVRRKL